MCWCRFGLKTQKVTQKTLFLYEKIRHAMLDGVKLNDDKSTQSGLLSPTTLLIHAISLLFSLSLLQKKPSAKSSSTNKREKEDEDDDERRGGGGEIGECDHCGITNEARVCIFIMDVRSICIIMYIHNSCCYNNHL